MTLSERIVFYTYRLNDSMVDTRRYPIPRYIPFDQSTTQGTFRPISEETLYTICAQNTAAFVFTDLENFTGWGNNGLVVLLGFLQVSLFHLRWHFLLTHT